MKCKDLLEGIRFFLRNEEGLLMMQLALTLLALLIVAGCIWLIVYP